MSGWENLSVWVLLWLWSVTGWFSSHTYQSDISALLRSARGDAIAIPCGLLVLTAFVVGRVRILERFALFFALT